MAMGLGQLRLAHGGAISEGGCILPWSPRKRSAIGAAAADRVEGHVELVKAAYELTLDRSDPEGTERSIDAFLELVSDSVVFVPEGGATQYRGRRALRRLLAEAATQWESLRYEIDEITDLGGGDLIACGKVVARLDPYRPCEIPYVNRWTIEAGQTVRIRSFRDRDEALEASGRRGTRATRAAY
jgi:ketosteroid isomerase-like protein